MRVKALHIQDPVWYKQEHHGPVTETQILPRDKGYRGWDVEGKGPGIQVWLEISALKVYR